MSAMCSHVFTPGQGYFEAGLPTMPAKVVEMEMPSRLLNGSQHYLKTRDGQEMAFEYIAAERAWRCIARPGNRMAHGATYLASHGWTYSRPNKTS